MASLDPWSDYENLKVNVRHNTVDKLKQIISGLNEECWTAISKSGKKQELIDRIIDSLHGWRHTGNVEKWNKARAILYQVRASGLYRGSAQPGLPPIPAPPSFPAPPSTVRPFPNPSAGPSAAVPRYDAYSATRKPVPPMMPSAPVVPPAKPTIRFKPSPFFQVEQSVSNVVECPESTNSVDRRQQTLQFSLTADQIAKLSSTEPKYQLRLYCTSSTYFALGAAGLRFSNAPCPIEFPPTCEVRVNNVQITANMKGLKKKPGTAPPADLGKSVRMTPGMQNRVEIVYVNSQTNNNQQPPPPKKYYIVAMLVQFTSVDQLIDRARKGKYRSSVEVLAVRRKQAALDDDDIVAGPQKMSLKCPLSYCRITTPCRSSQCVHPHCFDAMSWYSVNEQTTTWSCPICEKTINHEELIVDGYFDEILQNTTENVEDVMVEADGEWHTSDDRYASAGWKASHPVALPPPSRLPSTPQMASQHSPTCSPSATAVGSSSSATSTKEKVSDHDVVVLDDSDDEDEGRVKRELSPSSRDRLSIDHAQFDAVIDLTLDSDDEGSSQRNAGKRKAPTGAASPTEQIWKKSRVDSTPNTTVMRNVNGNVSTSASTPSASGSNFGGRPYNVNGNSSQRRPSNPQFFTPQLPPYSSYASPYTTPYYPDSNDTSRSSSNSRSSYYPPYTDWPSR
ncbi:hypothetical protein BV25DRAFT_1793319 [Artomyces pyxidatus]|uniref:Uncharacterized protein n=1 Tax=Artomyces pyxidatus TaxID=48021 RepID=A0ACB8TIP4_9AGAM|nr:hypothetical protein BV25DRAFT_1793319 [Artomyces pyxidatus]